jgi:hypothetical protein
MYFQSAAAGIASRYFGVSGPSAVGGIETLVCAVLGVVEGLRGAGHVVTEKPQSRRRRRKRAGRALDQGVASAGEVALGTVGELFAVIVVTPRFPDTGGIRRQGVENVVDPVLS